MARVKDGWMDGCYNSVVIIVFVNYRLLYRMHFQLLDVKISLLDLF